MYGPNSRFKELKALELRMNVKKEEDLKERKKEERKKKKERNISIFELMDHLVILYILLHFFLYST